MQYQLDAVKAVLTRCAETVENKKQELTEIDSVTGDGDLGVSMGLGFQAVAASVAAYQGDTIGELLEACGKAFNRAAPSTMGTLISMSIVTLGRQWRGKTCLEEADVVQVPRVMADTITRLGKAHVGDKTVLDALVPFADALEANCAAGQPMADAYRGAIEAAKAGRDSTKGMIANVGRARWLSERAAEHVDGGASLCVFLLEGLL